MIVAAVLALHLSATPVGYGCPEDHTSAEYYECKSRRDVEDATPSRDDGDRRDQADRRRRGR